MNTFPEKMQAKKKVLFFPFDLLSHYLRCLVLAHEHFDKDQYEVLFLSSSSYNSYVEEFGYKTFHCEQFDSDKAMKCAEKFDFSWLNELDIERILFSQLNAIKQLNADLVVGDVAPALKMAAEIAKVEYVALMNGYMTKYYSFTRKISRTHEAYKYSKKLPEKYFDIITRFAEKISFKIVHRPFKRMRKKYNLVSVDSYISEMEGDRNIICDLPELFPQKNLPSNYEFVKPLMYRPTKIKSEWLGQVKNDAHVIFICMGSTGDWGKLKFLNSSDYFKYSIITAGDKNKVLFGSHIISCDFVNIDDVLNISNLMICHGGNGTIYHGLKKGIFMFCLTSHFEQEWNVDALERIQYGQSADDFNTEDWAKSIDEFLKIKLPTFFK